MEKLQKERSIARSIFTRNKNKFIEVLTNEKDNQTKLGSWFDVLTEKAQALFRIDELIMGQWMAAEDYSEDDIIKDSESADMYKQDFQELRRKYEGIVQPTPTESHYDSASVSGCGTKHTRRLPKLELAKFDGQAINWLGFWSSFKKIHNDQSIDDDDKMAYLTQSMVSESAAYNLIKSFPPCGENYTHALEQLKMRYGRDELLIEIYVRELLSLVLQQAKETNTSLISELYDKLKTQLRALEQLGVTSEKYAAMLYPLVESALPEEILRVWERQRQRGDGADILKGLLDFVKIEVESEERIQLTRKSLKVNEARGGWKMPTAACLVAGDPKEATPSKSSDNTSASCIWCDKLSHSSLECSKAPEMTVEARRDIVEKKKACFACLKVGHGVNRCRSSMICIVCQKRHAVLLCPDIGKESGASSSENTELMLTSNSNGATTLLQTLTVKIGDENVRAFIDTGSQRSYIREDIAIKLKIKPSGKEVLRHCLFGGVETKQESHKIFDLVVKDVHGKSVLNMTALSKEKICGPIPRIGNDLAIKQNLKQHKLTLTDVGEDTPEVGLLIGANYAGKIMTGTVVHLNEDLHVIQTKLGWTLQGIVTQKHDSIIATVDLCDNDIPRVRVLGSLGIKDPKATSLKSKTEEEIIKAFENERYKVPRQPLRPELLDNKRLVSLKEFEKWLELGIIQIDPGGHVVVLETEANHGQRLYPPGPRGMPCFRRREDGGIQE